ncbi:MAG: hypothetical protein HY706_05880 [Candidatus Hydrogenedentes bacterium]|nr:hypothetical protein [Candidatus Hydrogenedentota bacterium]
MVLDYWLAPAADSNLPGTRNQEAIIEGGGFDSRRLLHSSPDTSVAESVQTPALQNIAEEGGTPIQTLPDHSNDTVARILRATGVHQNVLPADLHQLLRVWFDLPETIRFAILNWNDIPEATRCALKSIVSQQKEHGAK